jgi:hypothetical protein
MIARSRGVALASSRRWISGLAVVAVGACEPSAGKGPLQVNQSPVSGDFRAEVHSAFAGAELLALGGDRLLLWGVSGHMSVRGSAGTWSDFSQPLQPLLDVASLRLDLLVLGQSPSSRHLVVLKMTAEGREATRWVLPRDANFGAGLLSDPPRVVVRSGVLQLASNGAVGPVEPHLDDRHHPLRSPGGA